MALQRRFWKWPGISPSLPWFMVQLDTEPQQVSRAQGPCDTCSFREEGLLHHQGTSHQVFPHAKPKGSSHSSFTTTMPSWALVPILQMQNLKVREGEEKEGVGSTIQPCPCPAIWASMGRRAWLVNKQLPGRRNCCEQILKP